MNAVPTSIPSAVRAVAGSISRTRWAITPGGAARDRTERSAIMLELVDEHGHAGRGEAAPVAGLSVDTLDEARAALRRFLDALPVEVSEFDDVARVAAAVTAPAARFAVETALLALLAARCGVDPRVLIPRVEGRVLAPSCVLGDDPARGRSTFLKIKVGPDLDLAAIEAIARAHPRARLRLDANRAWRREDTPARLVALSALPVDYVEEPCPDVLALIDGGLPEGACRIALDESLAAMSADDVSRAARSPAVAAFVLKPTLLGGLARCIELSRLGPPVLVTHALESELGRSAVSWLRGATEEVVARRTRLRIALARPDAATVIVIRDAFRARRPVALIDARLPAHEIERRVSLADASAVPEDTAFVLFTSGTTGAARGVVISRTAVLAAADASAATLGTHDDDRWLLVLSPASAGGLGVVVRALLAGHAVIHAGSALGPALADAMHGCTLASLVPAQLVQLLEDRSWTPEPRLRAVLVGGATAPRALLSRARDRGVPVLATYGLTETCGQVATAPLARAGDPDAPLMPLPGLTVHAGAPGSPDRIRVRGPTLATSYLNGAPIGPELVTGDVGVVTRDGALEILGRSDDVIVTGGHKVHPSIVERELMATSGVIAACVFAVPSTRWGEVVAAALVVEDRFDHRGALVRWRDRLPAHARPRELAIVSTLPLAVSGKIDRVACAAVPRTPLAYPGAVG